MSNKRKQLAGVGFLCLIVLSFVVTVQIVEAQRMPEWQRALVNVWSAHQVIEAERAQWPEAFALAPTYVIRDTGHFAYGAYVDNGSSIDLLITLPETPREVYCVVVRNNTRAQLVFVNYYTDNLYRSGWVVMEDGALPVAADTQAQLDALGCRLALRG